MCTACANRCPNGTQPTCTNGALNCNNSPIVLDPRGQGFHLTSLVDGVKFSALPGLPAQQMSWTDPTYCNGWLVLDSNGNGVIDDMTEMFGNFTSQPDGPNPN